MTSSTCYQTIRNVEKNDLSLLLSAKQGLQKLEIMLFDQPCLLTIPSAALCVLASRNTPVKHPYNMLQ